jgi:pullulanase/glycogen debranching enzyme
LKVAVIVETQVDGFRFDLMGHIMLSVMERARDALRALTVEQHGVDGSKIYLYGEGWDYAEVRKRERASGDRGSMQCDRRC